MQTKGSKQAGDGEENLAFSGGVLLQSPCERFVLGWPARAHFVEAKKVQLHLEILSVQHAGFLVILLVRGLPLP